MAKAKKKGRKARSLIATMVVDLRESRKSVWLMCAQKFDNLGQRRRSRQLHAIYIIQGVPIKQDHSGCCKRAARTKNWFGKVF